jgi:NAD(P)-dependent dehydrogenase (short-subunit alcohol dehydrogenase family)
VREIADLIAFLASDRSGYTSGCVITVDGGIASRSSII